MNIQFQHYQNQLQLEINKFENLYGDLSTYVDKQFIDNLHTMQVSKNEYISSAEITQQECEIYDYADLSCLENYERILKNNSGEFN